MVSYNIATIEAQLPKLAHSVEAGEEIILKKSGEPIAKIIPYRKKGKRKLGREKGKIWMSDDFTESLPAEILAEFYK
ncbi:MAG: type II toxin-antitoxin system Phd/YefM family antitoxin [Candidatus Omnitrophota bacterium]